MCAVEVLRSKDRRQFVMARSKAQDDRNLDDPFTLGRRRFLSQGGIAAVAAASAVTAIRHGFAGAIPGRPSTVVSRRRQPSLRSPPSFQSTPKQIGIEYGKRFAPQIEKNLAILVGSGTNIPRQAPDFKAWVKSQESLIARHWPWYIEEMHGVAEGSGKTL